jgi:TRAP-type C4-dicarboxylate transport system substrate-binding protein
MAHMIRIGVVVAVALLVGACGGGDTQRAGGAPAAKTTVLTLANGNAQTDELQLFIDKVDQLSDGRLRVKAVNDWRAGDKQYEKGLLEDVKAGKADLGWVGSRALASVGVKSFEPLNAPFLLDSYEIQDEVLSGDVAERMLGDLQRVGVTGVAVLPGPLRFLQLDRNVDGSAGLAGLRIGGIDSTIQQAALEAMGAEPVVIAAGDPIGSLNGVESYPLSIHGNHYVDTAKYTIADMPLWPRPFVIFANTNAWNGMSEADRKLLQQAAEQARPEVLAATLEGEQTAFEGMCKAGNQAVELGAAGRERMQQAVEPVLAQLRSDPATRDAMAEIESLSAGQSPNSIACPAEETGQPAALEGTFEATMRKSEPGSDSIAKTWRQCGTDSIKVTFELSDGRAVQTLDCPSGPLTGFDEPYSVFRDVIKFGGTGGPPFSARWELDGNRLRFSDPAPKPVPPDGKYVWGRTWIKTR